MKKYLFILGLIGVLFTACSSGEDVLSEGLTQEEQEAIIAEANLPTDVPISLGIGSQSETSTTLTRAPLESDAAGLFTTPSGKYLGVYGLAQKPQITVATPGPVAEGSINWATTDASSLMYLMVRNQPAKVVQLDAGDKIGNVALTAPACDVQFFDPEDYTKQKFYYYPYGNWYNYYFYGYYPREASPTETANRISVNYTINGTQDIIHGKAVPTVASPTEGVEGFNAKYLRSLQTDGINELAHLPGLALEHKLTQLRFYVQCTSATYDAYKYGEEIGASAPYKKLFQIQNLTLTQVPAGWTLTIADRTTPANEGTLARNGSSLTDIPVKKMALDNTGAVDPDNTNDDDVFNQTTPASTRKNIPYVTATNGKTPLLLGYAMIPTTSMMNGVTITGRQEPTKPYISFTIYAGETKDDTSGNSIAGSEYTPVDQMIAVPTDGLEAGKVYNVILNIPPPEEIHMHATLDQWATVTVTESSAQNINMTIE